MNIANEMQLYRLIYYSYSAVHVSGDVFAHHPEQLTYLQHLVIYTNVAAGRCHG